jgi:hypothetical protein
VLLIDGSKVSVVIKYDLLILIMAQSYLIYKYRVIYLTIMTSTNNSMKMVVVALSVALTFAVAGLIGVGLLTEYVVAQNDTVGNDTSGNMTGTANTSAFTGGAGMAPETKR